VSDRSSEDEDQTRLSTCLNYTESDDRIISTEQSSTKKQKKEVALFLSVELDALNQNCQSVYAQIVDTLNCQSDGKM